MSAEDIDVLGRVRVQDEGSDTLQKVMGLTDRLGSAFGGLADIAKNALGFALGNILTGALQSVFGSMEELVTGALDAQKIQAQLEAVITSTGGAAGMTADEVLGLSDALAQTTLFTDDAITEAQNLLLTFTNIGEEVFPAATETLLDMAAAMGTDAKGGAIQLGKALNDPIAGISALSRVGVTFTDEQKEVIKTMVETGDVAGAQKVILAELAKEFGGSAAAQAQTLVGKLENLKKNLADTAEGMIGALLPAAEQLFDGVIAPAIPTVTALMESVGNFVAVLLSGEAPLSGALDNLHTALSSAFGPEVSGFIMELIGIGFQLVGFFQENLPLVQATAGAVFGDIMRVVNELVGFFMGTLIPAIGEITGQANVQLPSAQQVFQTVMAAIQTAVRVVADFLIQYVIPAMVTLVQWVVTNWPTIQATIQTVMATVQQVITTILGAIQTFWNEWGSTIMLYVSTFTDAIQTIFRAFHAAAEGDWFEFGRIIREGFDENVRKITEIGARIQTWFATQDWAEIGRNVVRSIADGIGSAAQWIIDAAVAAARAAFEAAMGFLAGGGGASQNVGQSTGGTDKATGSAFGGAFGAAGNSSSTVDNRKVVYNVTINTQTKPDVYGELYAVRASAGSW